MTERGDFAWVQTCENSSQTKMVTTVELGKGVLII